MLFLRRRALRRQARDDTAVAILLPRQHYYSKLATRLMISTSWIDLAAYRGLMPQAWLPRQRLSDFSIYDEMRAEAAFARPAQKEWSEA